MRYLSITLPGRANVREPLHDPLLRLVKENGRITTVALTEGDLLSMLTDVAETLKRLKERRGATVPQPAEYARSQQNAAPAPDGSGMDQ